MVNVIVSSAGTSGPRGTGWLSGVGAPSNSIGLDGDFYIDTTNHGVYYGPKTAGVWPTPPNPFSSAQNNVSTVPPTINNDSLEGYAPLSLWADTTNNFVYVCSDAAAGAAIWTPVLPVGTTAGTVAAGDDSRIVNAVQTSSAATTVVSETSYGQSVAVGTDLTYAREDHTHGTPPLASGFGPIVIPLAIGTLGSIGTSVNASHSDHTHTMSNAGTPAPSAVGDVTAIGSSTLFSAANHVHSREGFGTVTPTTTFGESSADGTATTVSHSDHDHGLPALPNATPTTLGVVQLTNDLSGTAASPTIVSTHLTAPLPIDQGGTGSATQNFVDLTTTQNIGGIKSFTGEVIVPTPVTSGDATTKSYVDAASSGLSMKTACIAATTVALPANTYNNGASGVGATLTGNATGTLTVDGHLVATNDFVLIKNEAAPANNGIYKCTTAGAVGVAYVLTRSTDMDQASEIKGAYTFITDSSANAGTSWVVMDPGPFVVGTTAIDWTQFSSATVYTGGTGISVTGTVINLITPVSAANLPPATTGALGVVQLAGDLAGTDTSPQVTSTHLSSPLPLLQGGTGAATASGARTNLGLGTSAVENVNITDGNIAPLGTQSAGSVGQVADAGHVHPTTGVTLHSEAATSVVSGTSYGQSPVIGVDLTYAREDHSHGTPSLTNSAPAVTEAIGTAAAVGTATTPARADHVHPMAAAGTPTTSAVGDTPVTGAATTFASSNHVHGRESFGSSTATTTYGLSATSGTATTVSRSDHTHGTPSLTASAPAVTEAIGTAAALGVATTPALADHVHPMAVAGTPTTSAVGDSPSTGAATTFASSNHVHGREAFGAVVALSAFNTPSSNGTATTVSHSDHVHGAPAAPTPAHATTGSKGIIQLAGDLGGTAAAPSVLNVNGIAASGTPAQGQVLAASSSSAATWQFAPGQTPTSGVVSGAVLTFLSTNEFTISAGTGYVADWSTTPLAPTLTAVTIASQTITVTGTPATRQVNYWFANSAGTVAAQATPLTSTQRRNNLPLGISVGATGTGNVSYVLNQPVSITQPINQLYDAMMALGPRNLTGNVVAANGTNLTMNMSAGLIWTAGFGRIEDPKSPNDLTTIAETAGSFVYCTQLANSFGAAATTVDVSHYDVGGVITTNPGMNSTVVMARVWLVPSGAVGKQLVLQYSQLTYTSLAVAATAFSTERSYIKNPDLVNVGALMIGAVATVKNATQLSNGAQATFLEYEQFPIP